MNDEMSSHDARALVARLRAARGFANLTQEQLADRLGVDKQTVKRWENANTAYVPDAGRRIAIAAICDVPAEFLEHGFGDIHENEILERLRAIQETISYNGDTLASVREWVTDQVNELREGEDAPATDPPTPAQEHGQDPVGRRVPRAL